jgi:hypothetical protein
VIESWLHSYLIESVEKNLCTTIYCTTCGAMEFRGGVVKALARATGASPPDGLYRGDAFAICRALADVHPANPADSTMNRAVRCLLFDLCHIIGEGEAGRILGESWGGKVLRGMQEHHAARLAKDRALEAEVANARKRREERKRIAQEKHQRRLALKKERDRAWRESQGKAAGRTDPDL